MCQCTLTVLPRKGAEVQLAHKNLTMEFTKRVPIDLVGVWNWRAIIVMAQTASARPKKSSPAVLSQRNSERGMDG